MRQNVIFKRTLKLIENRIEFLLYIPIFIAANCEKNFIYQTLDVEKNPKKIKFNY